MIKITYISDGSKHFEEAINEYKKRFGKIIKLQKIKPTKKGNNTQIIQKDTENMNKILEKNNDFNIMLSLNGVLLDSVGFKNIIQEKFDKGININFIIGGAFGLNEKELKNINYSISLSKLTFPHGLALLVLLEQIYRSFQMINGKKYHY